MTLLTVLREISNSPSIHKCKWLNPWSNHNTVNLCTVFMIKLLQSSLRTKSYCRLFFQWFPFSLPLHYSQWLSLRYFSSQSFSLLFRNITLTWIAVKSPKLRPQYLSFVLISLSLILPPWWNLLRCNCQHEWWSVSVSVCLIAHLYTHFSTQAQPHYICVLTECANVGTHRDICTDTSVGSICRWQWVSSPFPPSLAGLSLPALHQARGHRIVRVRSISRNKPR